VTLSTVLAVSARPGAHGYLKVQNRSYKQYVTQLEDATRLLREARRA